MRRFLLAASAALLVGAFLFPATALAGGAKVDVCHAEGNGSYHLINISEQALQKHLDHGDVSPGDVVPGTDGAFGDLTVQTSLDGPDRFLQFDAGYVFDEACVPKPVAAVHWQAAPAFFDAQVTALDVSGNTATIWGTVTGSGGGSGASPGHTFVFTVTDASPDLVFWAWLTGPSFTGPFTVVGGDLTVVDAP